MDLLTRDFIISWLNPTPHATAVYASCSASRLPHATLASRRLATALPGPDLHRLIAPALPGAFPHSITSSAMASSFDGISRPSALGIDNVSQFRKLHFWRRTGDRVLVLLTAGNLAVSQSVISIINEQLSPEAPTDRPTLMNVSSRYRAARSRPARRRPCAHQRPRFAERCGN